MVQVIQRLIVIRLRKFLPAMDKLALAIFLCIYLLFFYCLNEKFQLLRNYSLLFFLDIFYYHFNRKDIELLKLNKKWRLILLGEYLVYSLSYLILFLINKEYIFALIYIALITICIILPEFRGKVMKYPFRLFDPFWHICWRRNKLILFIPIIIFLVVLGDLYQNENLIITSFFIASFFNIISSFQRETYENIKMSHYCGRAYIYKQFKTTIVNSIVVAIPLIFTLSIFQKWELLCFTPVIFAIPLVGIIFKYSFFNNQFLHQLMFAVFLSMLPLGISLIAIPFLYLKSVKTIKFIQHVSN